MNKILTGIILLMMALSADLAAKTLYIEEVIKGTSGQKELTTVKKSYYSAANALIKDTSMPYNVLIKYTENKVYLIDETHKKYSVLSIPEFKKASDSGMGSLSDNDILIKETGVKKKVDSYNCTEVVVFIPKASVKTSMWISSDLKAPLDLYFYFIDKTGIGNQISKVNSIHKKYTSYTVESETQSLNAAAGFSNINVKVKDLSYIDDKNIFDVPKGYTKMAIKK